MASSWRSLQRRLDDGAALSFQEAREAHSQVAYAESVVAPAVTAGEIVTAARAAEKGWQDAEVQERMADQTCYPGENALREALEAADTANIDQLIALDAEMRAGRPIHGLAVDSALCAMETARSENLRFLQRLSIYSSQLRRELGLSTLPAPAPGPESHRLRVFARLGADGRIEHGVDLADGRQVLPPQRFLPADAPAGTWLVTGDVEVAEGSIGKIRSRRLADGRIELGFVGADGEAIIPHIRYLPAGLPVGVWFRSSEIEVPGATLIPPADSGEE